MVSADEHLAQVREEEALVAEVERTREELRADARERLGVTGSAEGMPSLRTVIALPGMAMYPLFALGVLSIVDSFQAYAFSVLTPEISRALGVGKGAIAGVIALKTLAVSLAPLPVAALAQRRARRALLSIISAFLWSAVAISTGFVTLIWGLLLVLVLDGFTTGSVEVLHRPLLMDSYPPQGRVRVLSAYQGFNAFGNVLAPLLVALLSTQLGFTWRGVFVVLGLISMVGAVLSLRLRDPGFGRWDTDQIRAAVHERRAEDDEDEARFGTVHPDEVALGFFEIVRRLMLIPTVRRLLIGQAVLGILLIPFQTFLFLFLDAERRLRLGITQIPGGRAVFGPMTVIDNLRAFGTTVRRDRAALDASIDRCFDAFPRLAERRNQLASTLSGGEQQMLGLSKALILKPRLLLIDELSLGLAPVIVGQLLDMVRQINADGTAVVLVEQSVNIALGLADHAYFMEKGEVRFDGRSTDLLARDDLLRAVFLEGAGARNR